MATYEKKTKSWKARWQIDGTRFSKSGFSSKKNAELYEHQQKIKYEKELFGIVQKQDTNIDKIFGKYLKWAKDHKKPGAVKRDECSIKIWKIFFEEIKLSNIRYLTESKMDEFKQWRSLRRTTRNTFASKRTVNIDLITLRRIFLWAKQKGHINVNPIENIDTYKLKKPERPYYLTIEEIKLIENRAAKELKQGISVLVRTGLRSGELCALAPENIDLKKSQIILTAEMTKASYGRTVPFDNTVKEVLEELIKNAIEKNKDYLFCTSTGNCQTPDNLNRRFRNLLKKLQKEGLIKNQEKINIHVLRKTFISHKIMIGEEPLRVMEIVGHRDWSTFRRYLSFSEKYVNSGKPLPY